MTPGNTSGTDVSKTKMMRIKKPNITSNNVRIYFCNQPITIIVGDDELGGRIEECKDELCYFVDTRDRDDIDKGDRSKVKKIRISELEEIWHNIG